MIIALSIESPCLTSKFFCMELFNKVNSTVSTLLHPPTAFCQQIDIQHIHQVNLKFQF